MYQDPQAIRDSWEPLIQAHAALEGIAAERAQARTLLDSVEVDQAALQGDVGAAKAAYEVVKAKAAEHRAKHAWIRAAWISACSKHKAAYGPFRELEKADLHTERQRTPNEKAVGRWLPAWER